MRQSSLRTGLRASGRFRRRQRQGMTDGGPGRRSRAQQRNHPDHGHAGIARGRDRPEAWQSPGMRGPSRIPLRIIRRRTSDSIFSSDSGFTDSGRRFPVSCNRSEPSPDRQTAGPAIVIANAKRGTGVPDLLRCRRALGVYWPFWASNSACSSRIFALPQAAASSAGTSCSRTIWIICGRMFDAFKAPA